MLEVGSSSTHGRAPRHPSASSSFEDHAVGGDSLREAVAPASKKPCRPPHNTADVNESMCCCTLASHHHNLSQILDSP